MARSRQKKPTPFSLISFSSQKQFLRADTIATPPSLLLKSHFRPQPPTPHTVRTRLITLTVTVVLFSCLAVAAVGLLIAQQAIRKQAIDQLTTLREMRAAAIEDYFAQMHAQVSTLSRSPFVVEAAQELTAAFKKTTSTKLTDQATLQLKTFYQEQFLPKIVIENERDAESKNNRDTLIKNWPATPQARHLQHAYLATNTYPLGQKDHLVDTEDAPEPYRTAHTRHHTTLRDIQQLFGFYDVFLIAPSDLSVVYSVFKETDYATSLTHGPHANSGLAKAARQTLALSDPHATIATDFTPYTPSYDAPAAFLGSPIVDKQGNLIAALVVQAPADRIDAVMTGRYRWRDMGLGESGETYLVGPDSTMRSNSRFFLENPDRFFQTLTSAGINATFHRGIKRFNTTILQHTVDTTASRDALAGHTHTTLAKGYRGVSVLSSYRPLNIPHLNWAILSEIDEAEAFAPVATYRRTALGVTAGALALGALAAALLASHFVAPILKLARVAHRVGSGDYTARADITRQDETGELGARFNDMIERIDAANAKLRFQNLENEQLLQNILPAPIAQRLRGGENMIADKFNNVAVLFGDIVGFTTMATHMDPAKLVGILDDVFTGFDNVAAHLGIEKIKTIGDEYMAVCGLPNEQNDHVGRALKMSLAMIKIIDSYNAKNNLNLQIRVGIHHGPVVAGIIGKSKFIYDLWGDTVNIAARMQSNGVPGTVHVTQAVQQTLAKRYNFEARGTLEIKGKGAMETFLIRPNDPASTSSN